MAAIAWPAISGQRKVILASEKARREPDFVICLWIMAAAGSKPLARRSCFRLAGLRFAMDIQLCDFLQPCTAKNSARSKRIRNPLSVRGGSEARQIHFHACRIVDLQ